MPPFTDWLYSHVRRLRAEGFPLLQNVVRLFCHPSTSATTWHRMYVQGAYFRCHIGEGSLPPHATFDCGIVVKNNEGQHTIDVGILKQVLMLDYGDLKLVMMKVSWVKHTRQGQSMIKKDRHGFWMCKLDEREDLAAKNQFIFPSHVAQVFFISDQSSPDWKVILSNKPGSQRIIGKHEYIFATCGASINIEGMLPSQHMQPSA